MNLFRGKIKPVRLTFGAIEDNYFHTPDVHPIPLKEYDSGWFEKIKNIDKADYFYFKKRNNSKTVKHCPSFVEIFQNGYVIPSPCDYFLHFDEDGNFFWHTSFSFVAQTGNEDVAFHYDGQLIDHLPAHSEFLKIAKINLPLKLFTPNGYSVQMMRMPFGDHRQWEAIYGMLRTDRNHNINIQIGVKTTDQIFIKQGTPLCILVPFKREKFDHKMVDLSPKSNYRGKFYKIWKRHYLKTYGSEQPKFRQDYWKE